MLTGDKDERIEAPLPDGGSVVVRPAYRPEADEPSSWPPPFWLAAAVVALLLISRWVGDALAWHLR